MKNLFAFLPIVFAVACSNSQTKVSGTSQTSLPALRAFTLTSPAFKQGENIPSVYTCDSINISPELHWNKPSDKIKSYVLIMDDPDAPMGTWVHWVMFNIPAKDSMLSTHQVTDSNMTSGIKQGITSFQSTGYGGPCPPNGSHRYFFKLFAIDTTFNSPCRTTGEKKLIALMKGHIISEGELMGRYERIKKN